MKFQITLRDQQLSIISPEYCDRWYKNLMLREIQISKYSLTVIDAGYYQYITIVLFP